MEIQESKRMLGTGDWRNLRALLAGETDGFKWYVGEYEVPFSPGCFVTNPNTLTRSTSNVVRLAYVDVTRTKFDGIVDTQMIDELGVDLYRGCTFAGLGKDSCFFRKFGTKDDQEHWFIGEDYAHDMFGMSEKTIPVEQIGKHLETETIPSILKALVVLDVNDLDFRRRDSQQI
jgi:hypothetical protein